MKGKYFKKWKGHGSKHHIVPTSIGGPDADWNIFWWEPEKHAAWHIIFSNKPPSACINFIRRHTSIKDDPKRIKLRGRKLKAWETVFSDRLNSAELRVWSPEEAINFIVKTFLSRENIFLATTLADNIRKLWGAEKSLR